MVGIISHVAFLNEKLMTKSQFGIERELLLVVAFHAEKRYLEKLISSNTFLLNFCQDDAQGF